MDSKQSIAFIINPISGNIDKSKVPTWIDQIMSPVKVHYTIVYTEYEGHGSILAKEFVTEGYTIIVAVGGDGTIHEIASALVATPSVLGIIPLGSGNGLARHLGIPLDTQEAIELIANGDVSAIDTATLNGSFMVATAGLGFDAHVAHRFAKYEGRGFKGYVKAIIQALKSYKPVDIEIMTSDRLIKGSFFMTSIANISQFGNGFAISPLSDVQDGLLEICLIRKVNWFNMWSIAWAMYRYTLHKHPSVEIFSTTNASIKLTEKNNKIHIDGEPRDVSAEILIEVKPKSLLLKVPSSVEKTTG